MSVSVEQFDFDGGEEGFRDGVVPALSLAPHRQSDAQIVGEGYAAGRGVLTAAAGVKDHIEREATDYLFGFFATMYYAGLRPGGVNRLRETDCKLPETG